LSSRFERQQSNNKLTNNGWAGDSSFALLGGAPPASAPCPCGSACDSKEGEDEQGCPEARGRGLGIL